MDVWTIKSSNKKICAIGEIRWWSKDGAIMQEFKRLFVYWTFDYFE